MDNDKTSWSNVIVGPWPTSEKLQDSKPLKGGKTREQIVEEEMNIVDGLTENLMVSLIHSLKENDFKSIPAYGPLPVSVPGCVDGWFELHEKFGNIKMKDILSPTIKYAKDGFPVSELVSYYMKNASNNFDEYPNK